MKNYQGKRVLVTGGSGFIGSHLVKELQNLGADVYCTQHLNLVAGTPIPCDLREQHQVKSAILDTQPDYIFHLASQAIVGDGENNSRYTLDTNILGAINVLEYASISNAEHSISAVVVASTDKVMGRQPNLPYHEDAPLLGTHQVYEASKVCEDVLAQMACYSWKLPIGITRFGNVYGDGDMNFSRLIPGTIAAYLNNEQPVIRSNGQHYRDYLFVDDVVNGYLLLGMHIQGLCDYPHIFNFGVGKPYRVLDVVSMIREYFPKGLPPKVLYGAKDEIERQYVSGEKAAQVLGWYPKTNLQLGISETIEWYRGYFNA